MATKEGTKPATKPVESTAESTTPAGSKPTKKGPGSAAKLPSRRAKRTAKKRWKPRPLTHKQLAFCAWYVSAAVNMNATQAARLAGYKGNETTLGTVGFENMQKPAIIAEIEKRMAVALSGAEITIEHVLRSVQVVGAKALEAGKFSPALRSAELLGKYLKMWTDKIEHVQDVDDMTTDQLVALLAEITEGGGIDLGRLLAELGSNDSSVPAVAEDSTVH